MRTLRRSRALGAAAVLMAFALAVGGCASDSSGPSAATRTASSNGGSVTGSVTGTITQSAAASPRILNAVSTTTSGTFTVRGSGADIWNRADAFQFVSQPLSGNGSITARVVSQTNTNAWAKAGVMFRETLSAGSTQAFTAITPARGSVLQGRFTTGGGSVNTNGPSVKAPYWLRIVRADNTFTGYVSPDGVTWTLITRYTIGMASQAYVGLAVASHADGVLSTAVFDNVTVAAVTQPRSGTGTSGPGIGTNGPGIWTNGDVGAVAAPGSYSLSGGATGAAAATSAAPGGNATLSWQAPTTNTDGTALTNLAGYYIRYGTSAANMNQLITVATTGITTYVVDNLAAGTYYFAISAYTAAGVQSSLSAIVSKTI
jgi:predicted small secreted protein